MEMVDVVVSSDTRVRLEQAAREGGLSVSDFVRELLDWHA